MASYPTHVRFLPATELFISGTSESASSVCRAAIVAVSLVDDPATASPSFSEMEEANTTTVSLDAASLALLRALKARGRFRSLTTVMAVTACSPVHREMLESVLALSPGERFALLAETLPPYGLPADLLPSRKSPLPPRDQERKKLQAVEMSILRLLSKHGVELSRDCRSALDNDLSNLRRVLASLPM